MRRRAKAAAGYDWWVRTVEVLGPIRVAGVSVTSPTQLVLLAVLVAASPDAVPFSRLMDAVWDEPPPSAENSLHSHLTRLRKSLGSGSIVREAGSYRLISPTDVERFEALLSAESTSIERRRDDLAAALGLWRGTPFGLHADHRFVRAAADALNARRHAARRELATLALAGGETGVALAELRRLVIDHPLDEEGWVLLVDTLAADGRRAEAIRSAHQARIELAEAGLEPSTTLLDAEAKALGGSQSQRSGRVPRPLDELIGRDRLLDEVLDATAEPGWITLVGPGGVGKTRLAVEVVARLAGSIAFVDLTETATKDLAATIVGAVDAPLRPPYIDRLVTVLNTGPAWLVLDCCELVTESLALLGRQLLEGCPELRVLATSRTPVGVPGERLIDVAPLEDEAAVDLLCGRAASAGIRPPEAVVARELCRAVDCLPLHLEIIAGALRSLSPDELLAAAADPIVLLGGTKGSLDRSVARSVSLLADAERSTFDQLTMFRGPFVVEVARRAVEPDARAVVVDHVRRLRDLSLIVPIDTSAGRRLRMLDTVRSAARTDAERRPGHDKVEQRYASAMAERAREIGAGLRTTDELHWLKIAEAEIGELRAAHQLAIDRRFVDVAMSIPTALFTLVYDRLRADLASWADETLDVFGYEHPLADCVVAASALGAMHVDDHHRAWARLQQANGRPVGATECGLVAANLHLRSGALEQTDAQGALVIERAEAAGDLYLAVIGHVLCGLSASYLDRNEKALHHVRLGRRLSRRVAAPSALAYADYLDGEVHAEAEPTVALELLQRAYDRAVQCRSALAEGVALVTITTLHARSDTPETAGTAFGRAIRHWRDLGDWNLQWSTLRNLVEFLARTDQLVPAATLIGGIEAHGPPGFGREADRFAAASAQIEDILGRTEFARLAAKGRTLTNDELLDHALLTV